MTEHNYKISECLHYNLLLIADKLKAWYQERCVCYSMCFHGNKTDRIQANNSSRFFILNCIHIKKMPMFS